MVPKVPGVPTGARGCLKVPPVLEVNGCLECARSKKTRRSNPLRVCSVTTNELHLALYAQPLVVPQLEHL
jgi:hypothetical protein